MQHSSTLDRLRAAVDDRSLMPASCRDGSLSTTCRTAMPWSEAAAPAQRQAS